MNLVYPIYKAWKANGISPAEGYLVTPYAVTTTLNKPVYPSFDLFDPYTVPLQALDYKGEVVLYPSLYKYRLDLNSPEGALINTFDGASGKEDSETGTFTMLMIGGSTFPVITVKYTKFKDRVVLLLIGDINELYTISNANTFFLQTLPSNLWPKTKQYISGFDCMDNTATFPGALILNFSGSIQVVRKTTHTSSYTTVFTTSGHKSIYLDPVRVLTICYSLL